MAVDIGTENVAGTAKSTTWGTAVSVGANNLLPIVSNGINPDVRLLRSVALTGTPFRGAGTKGEEFYSGPVVFEADYETIHTLLTYAFGQSAAPAQQGADSAWQHDISVLGDTTGIHSTFVVGQSGLFVREYTTVKWGQVTLRFEAGQENPPQLTIQAFAHDLITDDSGTNTLTTLPDITQRAAPVFIEFDDIVVRMNATGGAALASPTDDIHIRAFEVTLSPQLRGDSVTTENAPKIDEPLRNGFFEVTGSIEFAEMENDDFIDLAKNKNAQKIDLVATGPLADGSTNYSLTLQLASVQFVEPGDVGPGGSEITTPTVSFESSKHTATPTGFTSADAIRALVINTDSTAQPA